MNIIRYFLPAGIVSADIRLIFTKRHVLMRQDIVLHRF